MGPLKLKERYGDWALVTGGHSGIGYCLSEQLAAEGLNVIIAARGKAALEEAKANITAKHQVEVRIVVADISSKAGVDGLIEAVKDLEIGILVNNAGVEAKGFFGEQSPEKIEAMCYLNMTAPTLLSRHYMGLMCARGKGAIMFVCSLFGFLPAPYLSVYGATKAYIKMLGEALISEMKPVPGMDVSILSPGLTDTPMGQPFLATNPGFPVDSPEHTAMVGLRGLKGKHVIPLFGNNVAAIVMGRCLPSALVRWNQRSMMSKLLNLKTNNPWRKESKKLQ